MIAGDILAAITPVVDAFEQLGVSYHIGGSVASSVYGVARSTLDADLVADLQFAQIAPFVARLGTAYYLDERAIIDAVQRRASFNLIHLDTMIKVDVFILKSQAFDQAAFQRTRQAALDKTDPRVFPLAAPEDVVLHKLGWYRAAGGVSDRQWNDILGVLKVQATRLDRTYLQQWAARLGLTDLLDRAWQEAGVTES
jgi:hypothetical protein